MNALIQPQFIWHTCQTCIEGFMGTDLWSPCCEECDGEGGWFIPRNLLEAAYDPD